MNKTPQSQNMNTYKQQFLKYIKQIEAKPYGVFGIALAIHMVLPSTVLLMVEDILPRSVRQIGCSILCLAFMMACVVSAYKCRKKSTAIPAHKKLSVRIASLLACFFLACLEFFCQESDVEILLAGALLLAVIVLCVGCFMGADSDPAALAPKLKNQQSLVTIGNPVGESYTSIVNRCGLAVHHQFTERNIYRTWREGHITVILRFDHNDICKELVSLDIG